MCIRDRYSATNPVAGVTYRAAPSVNVYAAYGRGFETPTLNDLAYRSTTVSYTHLDVYKRQGQTTALGMLVGALAILPLGIAQAGGRMLLPVLLPAAIGVAPVSYTHLDVYKRQRLQSGAIHGRSRFGPLT